jgi:hypothetical protein
MMEGSGRPPDGRPPRKRAIRGQENARDPAQALDTAAVNRWTVVNMKTDWKTIFPET